MNSSRDMTVKERIRKALLDAGAAAVGFAKAGPIDSDVGQAYENWIRKGYNAEMTYLDRHIPLRRHTDNVLPGAKTVISLAFSYSPLKWRDPSLPIIACYAYGEDYHKALRKRLKPVLKSFQQEFGGKWRVCIDSAPVAERFWALKAGIGVLGLNGCVLVDGCGSLAFLTEILTDLELEPDHPSFGRCQGCGICVKACPGKALNGDGTLDARKCISYLTIEKKGDFSPEERSFLDSLPGPGYLHGCDTCVRVCIHNKGISPAALPEFRDYREPLRVESLH